jgi:hypothetical protein
MGVQSSLNWIPALLMGISFSVEDFSYLLFEFSEIGETFQNVSICAG